MNQQVAISKIYRNPCSECAEHGVDRFGVGLSGVYAIPSNQLSEDDKNLLLAVSRLILHAGGVSLKAQMRIPKDKAEVVNPDKLVPALPESSYSRVF